MITKNSTLAAGARIFVNSTAPGFNKKEYHGTTIFIQLNDKSNILRNIFDDLEDIKYKTSINFHKCLERCEFWCGVSPENLEQVKLYDPLHYDAVEPQYKKEIQYKLLLKDESGNCEVNCGGKYIDLLTDTYVIEIKRYEDRFDVLKVLFYNEYYLEHKPRIHLFDQNGKKYPRKPMFERVCAKYNITLTYEN